MIGHSLGALVMERAVSQAVLGGLLIDRAEDRRRQHVAETCHTSLNDLKREQSRLAAKLEELNRTASLVPEGAPTNWLELELESCTNSHSMVAAEIKAAQSLLSSLDEITAKERGRLGTNFQIAFNAVTNLNAKAKTNIWTEDSQLLRTWRASYRIAGFKGELEPEEESAGASTKAVQRSLLERQGSLPPQARTEFTTATNALAQLEASTARAFELLKQINQAQAEPSRKLAQLRKETNLDSCIAEKEAAWRTHTNILAQRGELQKLQSRIDGTNAVLSGIAPINTARAADLIILANPASEAVTARKMISSFESNKYLTNVTQARPVVISVSSDADRVTKDIFNRAMQLHSLNKNFRDTPQRTESTRAAPHVPRLRSHRIEQLTNRTAHVEYYSQTALAHMLKANLTPPGTNEFKRFEFLSTTDDYTSASTNGFAINSFRLDRTGENRSGYWVVQAPPELIRGHNDIFSPKFFGLVSGLFKASGVLEPRPTPTTASSAPAGPPNPAATTPATVSLENKYAPSL
ncbi:MAG TPA: hypothetical protein VEH27_07610 [Methylomirabilota bacterium]|nr:hypothetical protein [Methylomirabilota bacterium]